MKLPDGVLIAAGLGWCVLLLEYRLLLPRGLVTALDFCCQFWQNTLTQLGKRQVTPLGYAGVKVTGMIDRFFFRDVVKEKLSGLVLLIKLPFSFTSVLLKLLHVFVFQSNFEPVVALFQPLKLVDSLLLAISLFVGSKFSIPGFFVGQENLASIFLGMP